MTEKSSKKALATYRTSFLPLSEPLFSPSCAPAVKSNFLAIIVCIITASSIGVAIGAGQLFEIANGGVLPPDDGKTFKAALGDVDGDRNIDIVFGSYGGANSIYLNHLKSDGVFINASNRLPLNSDMTMCAALADVDGDGDLDIMFGNDGQNRLYLNNGGAFFTDVTGVNLPMNWGSTWDIEFGDYDGDKDADAYITNTYRNVLLLNDGTGKFSIDVNKNNIFWNITGFDAKAGDVDLDGDLDIIVVNNSHNLLYINDGVGNFTDATSTNMPAEPPGGDGDTTADFGDVDGDGDLDLLVGNYTTIGGQDRLFLNNGFGVFTDVTSNHMPIIRNFTIATSFGDIDNDGDLDIFSAISASQNRLYLNDGYGFFTDTTSSLPPDPGLTSNEYGLVLGDLDGDDYLDAFATCYFGDHNYLYLSTSETKPNSPPTADAGPDQTVHLGEIVDLYGGGSSDPEQNYDLSYNWSIVTKPEGSMATLSDRTIVNPSFAADQPGEYVVQLIVTDSLGAVSASDQVKISTFNTPPVSDAGEDQYVIAVSTLVNLNASQSYDVDGDPLSFTWLLISKPLNSNAELTFENTSTPSFTADVHGEYVIQLIVSDFWVSSDPDTVTVSFENIAPVADAGDNLSGVVGDTINLIGTDSSDANGDLLTYSWSIVSKPEGSLSVIVSQGSVSTSFIPDQPGIYIVSLVANDGFVNSEPSNITIAAISRVTAITGIVQDTIERVNIVPDIYLKSENLKDVLTNKLNSVLNMIDSGTYDEAFDKLQEDILAKTDGCVESGVPDNNDWITDCQEQQAVYNLIMDAVNLLNELVSLPSHSLGVTSLEP